MNSTRSITIVGAGVAGLTIGYQLSRQFRITMIERSPVVGGLGRSWHYGDFHFDVGPHRFHTENAKVAAFIRDILQEEAVEIRRKSGARMFGRFHEWPLRPTILLAMPIGLMFRAAKDLVFRERLPGESFEADVINKYGRALYDIEMSKPLKHDYQWTYYGGDEIFSRVSAPTAFALTTARLEKAACAWNAPVGKATSAGGIPSATPKQSLQTSCARRRSTARRTSNAYMSSRFPIRIRSTAWTISWS